MEACAPPPLMASVLVVDDERDNREALSEALAHAGFEVIAAGDGEEGLVKLRAFHPAVVLLDLTMPRMNGWQFREAQRADPDVAGIPVIVVTALARAPDVDAAATIRKPVEVEELLRTVRRCARRVS